MWVKICGLTTEAGVDAAVAAQVDAIGFVFAPSRRQVTAQRAAQLARRIPEGIARVAVMLHPAQALVDEVWSVLRPDILQVDLEDLATLNVAPQLRVTPVLRAGRATQMPAQRRVLFEGPVSGVGATADWSEAARIARQAEVILAGGLNPENVSAAIARVQPFGVDVSSGVESAPGIKDPDKVHAFVRAARGG